MKTNTNTFSSFSRAKLMIIGFSFLCLSTNVSAQRYTHAVGLQYNHAFFNLAYTNSFLSYAGTAQISTPGITYKASLNFELSEQLLLSVTSYPFFGFMPNSEFGGFISYEIPLFSELHFKNEGKMGKFIGLGGTYYSSRTWAATPILGPKILAGLVVPIKKKTISFTMGYAIGLNRYKNSEEITYTKNRKSLLTSTLIYHFN